jgi:hypothetical protein
MKKALIDDFAMTNLIAVKFYICWTDAQETHPSAQIELEK